MIDAHGWRTLVEQSPTSTWLQVQRERVRTPAENFFI